MNTHSKKAVIVAAGLGMIVVPVLALAQVKGASTGGYCDGFSGSLVLASSTVTGIVKFFTCFLTKVIVPFLFAMATAAFIYGVFDFIRASANGEETGEKKQFMVWGIVALAVMFSVWGLVGILQSTFHVGNVIPQLPVNGQ
jgi:hypothetical protein